MSHRKTDSFEETERLRKAQQKHARQQRTAARRARQSDRLKTNLSFENYLEKHRRHTVMLTECASRMIAVQHRRQRKAIKLGGTYNIMDLLDED